MNYVIGFDKLIELNKKGGKLTEMKEKIYVFADYLPSAFGKHNACLLFNTIHQPKKGLYHFEAAVKPRELPLTLSKNPSTYKFFPHIDFKRVKEYRITRKFDKPNCMFRDFPEDNQANLKRAFYKDIESWKLGRVIKD